MKVSVGSFGMESCQFPHMIKYVILCLHNFATFLFLGTTIQILQKVDLNKGVGDLLEFGIYVRLVGVALLCARLICSMRYKLANFESISYSFELGKPCLKFLMLY
ncbi:hypothetical protein HS088_TW08G00860 [Tripterygium wilfordii]|uniref:Uncharacterized protein n=1 Tax=Tripterygium wilfordii TaxID=458696 RepID=A0A7J7DD22_TRIWF|nr:hypothetical protein HS088_TW08G00860 [Tripterygium wilfordii]